MKNYTKNIDDSLQTELDKLLDNYETYCNQNNLNYEKQTLSDYSMINGQIIYLETETEKGIVCWGSDDIDPIVYKLPDEIDFDIKTGIITGKSQFTLFIFN